MPSIAILAAYDCSSLYLPFLLLAIVLHGWWPPHTPSPMASEFSLIWLVLWLSLHCRWPLVRAICFAIPASLVGELYLADFEVSGSESAATLGSLLDAGLGNADTAPWQVLAPLAATLFLVASSALVAARLREPRRARSLPSAPG